MKRASAVGVMIADFVAFGQTRAVNGVALITAGALLEGAGVLMLVPIISLILSGASEPSGGLAEPIFTALGLETIVSRISAVLALFATLLVVRLVVLLFRDDMLTRLQHDFVVELRRRAFRRLSYMPWADVVRLQHGPVGHALSRDVDRVSHAVNQLTHGTVAIAMLLVQLVLAFLLAPIVTLIVTALGLLLFRSLRWLRDRAEQRGRELTDEDLTLFQTVGGFLRGLKPAKAHGQEGAYVSVFESAAERVAENRRLFAFDFSLARLVMQTASGVIAILAILLGLFVFSTPPESLVVALIILARLYAPLQALQNTIQSIRHAAPSYVSTRAIAGSANGIDPSIDSAPSEPLGVPPEIVLSSVSYVGVEPGAKPILSGVSARIPAARVTAVIGESGAGKSTLCDLAVGLLSVSSGEIRLNSPQLSGALSDTFLANRLRASVAYVGQEPFLYDDSLRHNLCWGCPQPSDEAIWQALETVGAGELARGLDGGLDGRIHADGMRFSGGERQRLRLARALLRRPGLLVLDEATNALDQENEARVLDAVLTACAGATVLLVSHRLTNLSLCDHVIVLEAGNLVETGPVGALAHDPASRVGMLLAQKDLQRPVSAIEKSDGSTISGVD